MTVVGVIAFALYEHFRIVGKCCHIDSLVVSDNHRYSGIGKQLIITAEKYAHSHGCTSMELTSSNWRQEAGIHDFYQKLGYSDNLTSSPTRMTRIPSIETLSCYFLTISQRFLLHRSRYCVFSTGYHGEPRR
jgi:ribosomal protein S18 acetylase RimI-like enzyme